MQLALATCRELPDWECDDDPLHAAFEARDVTLAHPVWNDDAVDWSAFDAVLIRTTWDYADQRDAFVAWADRVAAVTRLFNPPDVVRWNTDKAYLRDLEDAGIAIAPTAWLERGTTIDVAATMRARGWTRGFLKPRVGATSRETLRFTADAAGLHEAQVHVDRLLRTEDLLLQPYLPSVETIGELSAILIDGRLTHAVRKIPVPGDYRTQDDFGARDEPTTLDVPQRDLVDAVGARHEDLLYARVDLLLDLDGRPVVNELECVEPSLFFRHGPEAAAALADACCARVRRDPGAG